MKFRKKPIVIEAEQYDPVKNPMLRGVCFGNSVPGCQGPIAPHVHTAHRNQAVEIVAGDWIVPEPDGVHFYPIKADIFAASFRSGRMKKTTALLFVLAACCVALTIIGVATRSTEPVQKPVPMDVSYLDQGTALHARAVLSAHAPRQRVRGTGVGVMVRGGARVSLLEVERVAGERCMIVGELDRDPRLVPPFQKDHSWDDVRWWLEEMRPGWLTAIVYNPYEKDTPNLKYTIFCEMAP